ncbi:hypothetical protein VIN01S_30520 [Vibrio inusitatus NBRC 102082]|uniref:BatD protein n=1 Tax=Vibrio inusitatus NBRC 102082 TaxID=1219070 RepID=A0A4Y3HYY8_9VIBR|nr:BatD family protein [Vibrio inusitatus]GEA52248.1 hypothetical protein VIN01S_30520 [Vibrio inusitatus NBRC 102082]
MMMRLISLLFFLLVSWQAGADPNIALLVKDEQIVPGQQVNLQFEATTKQYFMDGPQYSLPYVANAMVKQENKSTLSGYSFINDEKFTSQRWSIQVYPNKVGVYLIPSMTVTLTTANEDGNIVKTPLKTKPLALVVKAPSELKHESNYLVSSKVSVEDVWSSTSETAKKEYERGDIIQRTVTIKAEYTSTFMMPDFVPLAPEGVTVSLLEPALSSHYSRGEHSTTLVQHISYSIDKPGQYALGSEQVKWWNPDNNQLNTWKASAKSIDAGGVDYQKVLRLGMVFLSFMICIYLARLYLIKSKPTILIFSRLFSSHGAKWLNSCYSKASNKTNLRTPLLIDASNNEELVKYSLQSQFQKNERVGIWQRIRLYWSV